MSLQCDSKVSRFSKLFLLLNSFLNSLSSVYIFYCRCILIFKTGRLKLCFWVFITSYFISRPINSNETHLMTSRYQAYNANLMQLLPICQNWVYLTFEYETMTTSLLFISYITPKCKHIFHCFRRIFRYVSDITHGFVINFINIMPKLMSICDLHYKFYSLTNGLNCIDFMEL